MSHPFIPAPYCAKLQAIYNYNGSKVQNVSHWRYNVPFTTTTMAELATAYRDWWQQGQRNNFVVANSLDHIEVVALDEENSPGIVFTENMPMVGLNALDAQLPGNVTFAVKFGTALRGRSFRGRMYHIGLLEQFVTGNRITGLAAIGFGDVYQDLVNGLGSAGKFKLVIVSYMAHGLWRDEAVVTPVTYQYVDEQLDSQRRRLEGRGV